MTNLARTWLAWMSTTKTRRTSDLKPTDVEGSHLRATIAVMARDKLLVFLTPRDVAATNNESDAVEVSWRSLSEMLDAKTGADGTSDTNQF
jgi:hypothetical protein